MGIVQALHPHMVTSLGVEADSLSLKRIANNAVEGAATELFAADSSDDAAEARSELAMPKLEHHEYYTVPSMHDLAAMPAAKLHVGTKLSKPAVVTLERVLPPSG